MSTPAIDHREPRPDLDRHWSGHQAGSSDARQADQKAADKGLTPPRPR